MGFAIVGGLDMALVLVPTSFGVAEWEFGTVTAMLNGLPLPALSLALLLAAGLARGARWQVRLTAVGLLALAVLILVGAVFYALTAPLALRAITEGVARTGVIKSVIKTTAQLVVYPVCFTWMALAAWRRTRT